MERTIKKIVLFLFIIILCSGLCYAQEEVNPANLIIKPSTEFSQCTKTFPVEVEKLFYLVLSATNEYNYELKEIQTKSGYIIFETGYRKFLASIIYVSSNKSMLKITPYSGNYDFPPEVVSKVFNYVEKYQNVQF